MSCHETKIDFIVINSLDEIPEFATESEEADYWGTHTFSDELLDTMNTEIDDLPPPGTQFGLSLGFSPDVAERLRALATAKGIDYVTMTRSFVLERLSEEERREGIVAQRHAS